MWLQCRQAIIVETVVGYLLASVIHSSQGRHGTFDEPFIISITLSEQNNCTTMQQHHHHHHLDCHFKINLHEPLVS